jgi:hypothetical protein
MYWSDFSQPLHFLTGPRLPTLYVIAHLSRARY